MAKHISQTKDRSGHKPLIYQFKGNRIEVLPYFLYEVSIDKLWKNGFCNLKTKYFKTGKLLKIRSTEEFKYYPEYKVVRSISLIGAPYDFIKEHNLLIYKPHNSKK